MEENVLKKSEFKSIVATVTSTVTILIAIFVGGIKTKDAIVDDIKRELVEEISSKIKDLDAKQAMKDREQDYKIEKIEIVIEKINR